MNLDPERKLCMTRRFEASPERVFDAWIRPELVSKWLFKSPVDEVYTADLDTRVGGQWRIMARRVGVDYTASGEYLEIDRPRRLVFTFEMQQFSPNTDRVTIEIVPEAGGCMLTFTQEGIDIDAELNALDPGMVSGTEEGWSLMFENLVTVVAEGSPQ